MQMRRDVVARFARVTDLADLLTPADLRVQCHRPDAQVRVVGRPAATVVDLHQIAVSVRGSLMGRDHDLPGSRGDNRVTEIRVRRAAPVEVELPRPVRTGIAGVAVPRLIAREGQLERGPWPGCRRRWCE